MTDFEDAGTPLRSGSGGVNLVRAGVVIVCFLIGLILLLGKAGLVVASAPPTTHHHGHPSGPVNRATTRVQVANASAVQGDAATVSHQLKVLGWNVLGAETASSHRGHWAVYYAPGFQRAARMIAASTGVPPQHVFLRSAHIGVAGSNHDDVVVVIGASVK